VKIALFTETFLPKVDGIVTRLTKTIEFLIKNGDEVIIFFFYLLEGFYYGNISRIKITRGTRKIKLSHRAT